MDEKAKKHHRTKIVLRIIGICLLVIAVVFTVIGFVSFITAFNKNEQPKLFWMMMIGLPSLAIGLSLTIFSFQKEISSYCARESAPVFNETAKNINPGLKDIANAVSEGIKDGEIVVCRYCGEENRITDKFCTRCGKALDATCPYCGAVLENDDVYCGKCGKKVK